MLKPRDILLQGNRPFSNTIALNKYIAGIKHLIAGYSSVIITVGLINQKITFSDMKDNWCLGSDSNRHGVSPGGF